MGFGSEQCEPAEAIEAGDASSESAPETVKTEDDLTPTRVDDGASTCVPSDMTVAACIESLPARLALRRKSFVLSDKTMAALIVNGTKNDLVDVVIQLNDSIDTLRTTRCGLEEELKEAAKREEELLTRKVIYKSAFKRTLQDLDTKDRELTEERAQAASNLYRMEQRYDEETVACERWKRAATKALEENRALARSLKDANAQVKLGESLARRKDGHAIILETKKKMLEAEKATIIQSLMSSVTNIVGDLEHSSKRERDAEDEIDRFKKLEGKRARRTGTPYHRNEVNEST